MERLIETALGQAGDFAGAALWRQATAHLSAGVRIGVLGVDPRSVRDAVAALPDTVTPVPLVVHDNADAIAESLLGVHAVIWATPATGPLSATERLTMQDLDSCTPTHRAVVLTRLDVLSQLSDTPQAEHQAIVSRVEALCRNGWVCPQSAQDWLAALLDNRSTLAAECRVRVATVVLTNARVHTDLDLADMDRTHARLQEDVDRLRTQDEAARAEANETARHVLGSLVRHTTALTRNWQAFTRELHAALQHELEKVDQSHLNADVVSAWLAHVLDTWLTQASRKWVQDLATDLEGVANERWLSALHLLITPVTVSGVARTPGWRHRLVVTAALGGGATLAVAGFWTPGLTLVAGGAALAGLRRLRQTSSLEQLTAAAGDALDTVNEEQITALTQQIDKLQDAIHRLEHHDADVHNTALGAAETALQTAKDRHQQRQTTLLAAAELLDARLAAVQESA